MKCTWREACKAADYVLEHFGDKLLEAEMRLVDAGKRFLIPVLLLIVENVDNREESLKRVSKRTYFRHRNALLRFFSKPQP